MPSFVLLDVGRPTEVDVTIDQGDVWIDSTGVASTLGWELKPEGFCKDDVCIPVAGNPGIMNNGAIRLAALADLLGRPLALSLEERAAYLGPSRAVHDQTMKMLDAPDFTFPDLDGPTRCRSTAVQRCCWPSGPPGEAAATTCPGGRLCTTSYRAALS